MYNEIYQLSQAEQIEYVANRLVEIASVNSTKGEFAIAEKVEEILRSFPYFQENPSLVWTNSLSNDKFGRKNVFAFLPKRECQKTVIYHSHMDTVGVEDYGQQKDLAFSPDDLLTFFKSYEEDIDVQKDALSGDWAFGRGMLDMKSGIAVNLMNLLYYTEHFSELPANILLMVNCVEENDHTGVIESIPELVKLKEERDLTYVAAINTDFVSPLYEGYSNRYIYTGAAGKLLSCFYIKGREIHVGNTLAGIDPTLLSSAINLKINTNINLCEELDNEEILPSSCLMQRDQKDFYNVQTAKTARMYFNTFLYEKSAKWIMNQLLQASEEACKEVTRQLDLRYESYRKKIGIPENKISHDLAVFTFEAYLAYLSEKGYYPQKLIETFFEEHVGIDRREAGFELIDYLEMVCGEDAPKVILFFAPPFCPHNYIDQQSQVNIGIKAALADFSAETGEIFKLRKFFPYLSDSSYLSMNETPEDLESLVVNFPGMETIYPLPIESIRQLNIPAVDIGVYGIGAHTWKERIYKPYSYSKLPKFIRKVSQEISKEG